MPANVGTYVLHAEGGPNSIFAKLGGQQRLELFVDGFYDLMAKDKDSKKFFENRNMAHLKKRTVDFLGGMWGGDAYRGPDLFLAHTGLGISVHTFDVMMKACDKQLKVMKVDQELAKLITKDIAGFKEPLCDPSGRLAKAQNRKNLAGGDPFDDAANRAAFAENQKKLEERKAKLEAFKKKKRQEEKEAAERKAQEEKDNAEKKEKKAEKRKKSDKKKEKMTEEPKEEEILKETAVPGTASTSFDSAVAKEISEEMEKVNGKAKYITVERAVVSL